VEGSVAAPAAACTMRRGAWQSLFAPLCVQRGAAGGEARHQSVKGMLPHHACRVPAAICTARAAMELCSRHAHVHAEG